MRDFVIPPRPKTIEPAEDFIQQMKDSNKLQPKEADFVPCPYYKTDLRSLSTEQYEYYLYWRDEIRKGNILKSDYGYEYIRICELINLEEERGNIQQQLALMIENSRHLKTGYMTLMAVHYDACVAFHLPTNEFYCHDGLRIISSISLILTSPISFIEDPEEFCAFPMGDSSYYYDEEFPVLFNKSLVEIDSYLTNTTGKGVLETYGGEMKASQIEVFKDYFYEGERQYRIKYIDVAGESRIMPFLCAVYRCCLSVLYKSEGKRGPTVPSILTKEMRSIISNCLNHEYEFPDDSEKYFDSTPVSDIEGDGLLIIPASKESIGITPTFKKDIERYRYEESEARCQYIPSGYTNIQYSKMTPEQLSFYIYWRTQVRNGKYPTTDLGYVWLYLCELINSDEDPTAIYQFLVDLGSAYESSMIREENYSFFSYNYDHMIMRTALDYAVVKELPLPSHEQYPSILTVNESMRLMLQGEQRTLSPNAVAYFCNATKATKEKIDDDVALIFCKCLVEASDSSNSSKGATSYCHVRPKTVKIWVFENLKYYGYRNGNAVMYPVTLYNYGENQRFEEFCKELLKAVIKAVNARRSGKRVPDEQIYLFGSMYKGLKKIVDSYFADQASPTPAKKRKRALSLDRGLIDSAQEALESTTELMITDESDVQEVSTLGPNYSKSETEPEESKESVKDLDGDHKVNVDPADDRNDEDNRWAGFMDSLDDDQISFLMLIFIDPDNPVVSKAKPKTIDSINDLAMDRLGDVLIESGKVLPEYEKDLRSALASWIV